MITNYVHVQRNLYYWDCKLVLSVTKLCSSISNRSFINLSVITNTNNICGGLESIIGGVATQYASSRCKQTSTNGDEHIHCVKCEKKSCSRKPTSFLKT